ncbi:hypothetical protein ACVWYG_002901 [Pedobacter sp. UYEF25]
MKNLPILLLYFLILLSVSNVFAQSIAPKLDTIYYFLDTAAVPIKDRMFVVQEEDPEVVYQ